MNGSMNDSTTEERVSWWSVDKRNEEKPKFW